MFLGVGAFLSEVSFLSGRVSSLSLFSGLSHGRVKVGWGKEKRKGRPRVAKKAAVRWGSEGLRVESAVPGRDVRSSEC